VSAKARNTDPITSHEAAASLSDVTEIQRFVLKSLNRPRTDKQIVEAYNSFKLAPIVSDDSTIRSRRNELAKAGLIRNSGKFDVSGPRRQIIWERVS
jgi:hypothetical protein